MNFWIFVILQIISGIIAGEAAIRKTPEGEAMLNTLSKAGLFFLRWRAYANYKKELRGLQRLFGIATLIFFVICIALGKEPEEDPIPLLVFLYELFMFLYMSMRIGSNFKEELYNFSSVKFIAILPWGIFLFDYMTNFRTHHIQLFTQQIVRAVTPSGIVQLSDFFATIVLSGTSILIGLVAHVFMIMTFSVIPLIFLFLMAATSTLSRKVLFISPIALYNVSVLYFFLIGPILIALESKGII